MVSISVYFEIILLPFGYFLCVYQPVAGQDISNVLCIRSVVEGFGILTRIREIHFKFPRINMWHLKITCKQSNQN